VRLSLRQYKSPAHHRRGPIWSPDGSRAALGSNLKTDPAANQYEYHLTVLGLEPDFWP